MANLTIKTSAVNLRNESRNQRGSFTAGDYLRLISRIIRTFIFNPYPRHLIKDATTANPVEHIRYMGYGLFVGQKL